MSTRMSRTGVIATMSAELLKLRKRPAVWVLGGAWLGLTLFFGYALPYISYRTGTATGPSEGPPAQLLAEMLPAATVPSVLAGYPLFAGALVVILGALMTGGEYGFDTWKTVLTQRPGRLAVLGGMLGALAVVIVTMVLTTFVVGAGAGSLVAAVESAPGGFPPVTEVLRGLGAGTLIMLMWGLLGALAGIAFRGTALAVGLGLVWALVLENLLRLSAQLVDVFDSVQRVLPGVNAGSLVAALGGVGQGEATGTPGVGAVVGGGQAAVVLAVYAVAFVLIAATMLRRRDVA